MDVLAVTAVSGLSRAASSSTADPSINADVDVLAVTAVSAVTAPAAASPKRNPASFEISTNSLKR